MKASSSHVRPALSRARDDHAVDSMRLAVYGLGEMQRREQEAFDAAVSAELVACTLGQRERPELRLRPTGQLRVVLEAIRRGLPQVR